MRSIIYLLKKLIRLLKVQIIKKKNPDHPYRILRADRGSGSGKTNALLNLIRFRKGNNHEKDIDKIYLHVKDPH